MGGIVTCCCCAAAASLPSPLVVCELPSSPCVQHT
jgi:hypothetical protein